jgi:hypothetical protein
VNRRAQLGFRVPTKPFCRRHDIRLKRIVRYMYAIRKREGTAMNAIVAKILKSKAVEAQAGAFNVVALFSGVGLLASLYMATLGFDVSGGIF